MIQIKSRAVLLIAFTLFAVASASFAGQVEPPPDPGFEISVRTADVIVDADIVAGGPFRAAGQVRKIIKGEIPKTFELEGYNSYNWDTVHMGFATGKRFILFLSRTGRPDVFSLLTPAAPRLSVQQDGVLLSLGDPPFRIPIKRPVFEEGLALLLEAQESGKVPEKAEAFLRGLWDAGDIEPRYFAVALAGALRDPRAGPILIEASKDKLLKLRLTAVEALGKVGSPPAVAALRALLKDEKASVAREAARVLASVQDVDSLPDLLEWVRKAAIAKIPAAAAANAQSTDNAKIEAVAIDVLKLAGDAGPLLKTEVLCRSLFAIARAPNETLGREALQAIVKIGQGPQVTQLLELADDNTYELHAAASVALQRLTLKSFRDFDEFRSWWTDAEKGFGEDMKRDRVEAAAKSLAKSDESDVKRNAVELIRMAQGEIALVSAAPLLLNHETSTLFHADDIAAWRSPLAVPFLIERLGRTNKSERSDALEAMVQLAAAHPRLKEMLWPLIRAALADDESTCRHAAQAACGSIPYPEGADALLDATEFHGSFESQDASKALYGFTARTMGFSTQEPMPEQLASQKRLRGWWESSKQNFIPVQVVATRLSLQARLLWPDVEPAARAANLETFAVASDSAQSAVAFGVLYAEQPANSPYWKKLAGLNRQRDRAHGVLGFFGGDAALVTELSKRLGSEGEGSEAPLCKALSLVALASVKAEKGEKPAGVVKVVEWLEGSGAKSNVDWRRMAIVSLGLADQEPKSLAYLGRVLDAGLSAGAPDPDAFSSKPSEEYELLTPALIALCARTDSTALLVKTLEECSDVRQREKAARALSLRRYRPAVASMLKAVAKAGRYSWQELCRAIIPLLEPSDAPAICALFDDDAPAAHCAAAFILAVRPEIGVDAETRGALINALRDKTSVVKYFSAVALGKRRAASAIKGLTELLTDEDQDLRAAAAEALGQIGDLDSCAAAATAALEQYRLDSRWLRAMAIAGNKAQFALLMKLCKSNSYLDQRSGLEAISASDETEALDMLLKVYRNDEAASQTVAADALATRGGRTVSVLQEDIKSPDKNIRARALHLLSRIKTPTSREALENAAKTDDDPALRGLAELGLRLLGGK